MNFHQIGMFTLALMWFCPIGYGQGRVTIPLPGKPLPPMTTNEIGRAPAPLISESEGKSRSGKVVYPVPGKPLPRFIHRPKLSKRQRSAPQGTAKGEQWRDRVCKIMVNKFARGYADLEKFIQQPVNPPQDNPGIKISSLRESDCSSEGRVETIKAIASTINDNSRKIGVIIPQSGPYGQIGNDLLEGMKKVAHSQGIDFAKQVIVRDSHGDPNLAQRALAELVLVHNVSAVVGGLQAQVAQALLPWADQLSLPVILLSSKIAVPETSKTAFRVFPDQRELAFALAETCRLRTFKRVAFLYPTGTGAEKIAQLLEEELKLQNIAVVQKATYQPTDYNTMENAARTIFRQHSAGREQEYRNLVWRARSKARKAGVPFNSRMIVLPPVVGFDAVFIADNFKNVRHMVKIFQYLGVKKLPLFGHHEWRSMALVSPYDPYLDGSFFADFIGSYRDLPKELNVTPGSSSYFVKAEYAQKYDFNLIGLRAFEVAARAVNSHFRRRKVIEGMASMEEKESTYFKLGPVFRSNHHSHWPAYIFSVQNRGIYLTAQFREGKERAPLTLPAATPEVDPAPQQSPTVQPQLGANMDRLPDKLFTH